MCLLAGCQISEQVLQQGYPNVFGARIPIKTHLNLDLFEELLADYHDKVVVEFLRYGWPANCMPGAPQPTVNSVNHLSALRFPEFVGNYIKTEMEHNAVMGPFTEIPFEHGVGISPFSTHPKQDSDSRRAILDLSFPEGASVNDFTPKDSYLGLAIELKFPNVDMLAQRMKKLSNTCQMWKCDVSQCFRQFGLDPADYRLFGYIWEGLWYFGKVLAMGHRIAPYICQRVMDAMHFIHCKIGLFLLNYVDDFLGAETRDLAQLAYDQLGQLLKDLNLVENESKATPPSEIVEFLGVTFNSQKGTMEVSQHHLDELHELLLSWLDKEKFTRTQLESLIGKLQFITACVRPGRVFICRLLNVLRETPRTGLQLVPHQLKLDVTWWLNFLPTYNSVSIAWMDQCMMPDSVVACDASLTCLGGYLIDQEYFYLRLPPVWKSVNIAYLEMWAVILTIVVWGDRLRGKCVVLYCDNASVVAVLNHGRSKDLFLQAGMREIAFALACTPCELRVLHIGSRLNQLPDLLSRWTDPCAWQEFRQFARGKSLK